MKYTKEEIFANLLVKMSVVDDEITTSEYERILLVAEANGLETKGVKDTFGKIKEYNWSDVFQCIKDADEEFKDLLFFACIRVIIADGKISLREIKELHLYADKYFEWTPSYVSVKLLLAMKENPALEIVK